MLARAFAIWCAMLVLAVANGAIRGALIVPQVGDHWGHVISSLSLSTLVLTLGWLTMPWIHPEARRDVAMVAVFWVTMTIAFEFLAGHYLFGASWNQLLADYNIAQGRIWGLVLIATLFAPFISVWGRGLLRVR